MRKQSRTISEGSFVLFAYVPKRTIGLNGGKLTHVELLYDNERKCNIVNNSLQ